MFGTCGLECDKHSGFQSKNDFLGFLEAVLVTVPLRSIFPDELATLSYVATEAE